jgi:prevent-host-death family protein
MSLLSGKTMKTLISATDANRRFSELLSDAERGVVAEITKRGKIVARLVPAESSDRPSLAERRMKHMELLRKQQVLNLPRISRDQLYD